MSAEYACVHLALPDHHLGGSPTEIYHHERCGGGVQFVDGSVK